MPFTFKLSQRLARMRHAIPRPSTAAPAAGEGLTGAVAAALQPGAQVITSAVLLDIVTLVPSDRAQCAVVEVVAQGNPTGQNCDTAEFFDTRRGMPGWCWNAVKPYGSICYSNVRNRYGACFTGGRLPQLS
jgi:hypothetical protein